VKHRQEQSSTLGQLKKCDKANEEKCRTASLQVALSGSWL
jgi:hypothetical protein